MANEDIETSFQAAIDAGKINGVMICAINAAGSFVYNKVLGERTLLSGQKRTEQLDDIFCLASATKLITTIAALQCVDDGLLDLTDDLSAIIPELGHKQVLTGFSEAGDSVAAEPLFEPRIQPITLEMLLTHSAGTSYDFIDPHLRRWRKEFVPPPSQDDTTPRSVEAAFDAPLSYQPGRGWMYSSGLDWAGRVIEQLTGLSLGAWMQERIFTPLGITSAQFQPVSRNDLRARLVDLNPDDPDAVGLAVLGGRGVPDVYKRMRGDFGGHGLVMSAVDYIKILHELLVGGDGKLLKRDTVNEMFTHHLSPEATAAHQAALKSPFFGEFFRQGLGPEIKAGHGLGGLLTLQNVEGDGGYGRGTLTWGGGVTLTWFVDRERDLCAVCAIQARLPVVEREVIDELKVIFRRGVYRERDLWKKNQEETS